MIPARGKVLVKPVETPETLSGGKILLTEKMRQDLTSHQMEVLAIGYPERCLAFPDCERRHVAALSAPVGAFPQEPHFHPCDAKVGDWVLVAHRSLSETDTDGVFICSQDSVLAVLTAWRRDPASTQDRAYGASRARRPAGLVESLCPPEGLEVNCLQKEIYPKRRQ